MLVMLIIFMVAAPMMQRGLDVNLPEARRADAISAERLFVTVPLSFRADGLLQVDEDTVLFDESYMRRLNVMPGITGLLQAEKS